MIEQRMQDAINKQINAELYSSYLYLSMAAYFEDLNLPGFANWMRVQTQEENFHAMKFFDYLSERGGRIILDSIVAPPTEWTSPLDVFEYTYKHEQLVTSLINDLVDLSIEIKDHATNNLLQWYVAEQVEEESNADAIVKKLKLMGDAPGGLFMIDQELAARVFVPPVAAA
jgi:ferritin